MSINVRLFCYSGLFRAPAVGGVDLAFDSVLMTKNRYLGSELLTPDTVTADSSDATNAPDWTRLALVQVQNGKRAHLEIWPAGQTLVAATTNSPIIEGNVYIEFGPGWRISLLECSE